MYDRLIEKEKKYKHQIDKKNVDKRKLHLLSWLTFTQLFIPTVVEPQTPTQNGQ